MVDLALWRKVFLSFLLALAMLSLSRVGFMLNSWTGFAGVETYQLFRSFFQGVRFDVVAAAYALTPYYLILLFVGREVRFRSIMLGKTWYLFAVIFMLLMNFIDAEFYKFTDRRSTSDLFEFAFVSNDIYRIIGPLLRDFWHLLVAWLGLSFLTIYLYNFLENRPFSDRWWAKPAEWVARAVFSGLMVIAMRGGLQPIPLTIQDATANGDQHLSLLTLNTPFTVFKTLGKEKLPIPDILTQEQANAIWQPVVTSPHDSVFGQLKGHNVVVIIMESLGCDYIASQNGRGEGFAPFTDSLITKGLYFNQGFANGHRSIEGIPAVLSSTPTLMFDPFITSPFAVNKYNSLANTLGELGYTSIFYHGGNNGTMGFDLYAKQAGFQKYIGRSEYPDQTHYDGTWGIFDHHFLTFMAQDLTRQKAPFVAGLFTLSSHHPYTIPHQFQAQVKHGDLPIHVAISYADIALRMFFEEAKKQPWYANTLFVLTSDHTSLAIDPKFKTSVGNLRVPILYYHPTVSLRANTAKVTQQTDVMPTIHHLLGYDKPTIAFGESVFKPGPGAALSFLSGGHQLIMGNRVLRTDGHKATTLHSLIDDPLMRTNLLHNEPDTAARMEQLLWAMARQYAVALNLNRMTPENWNKP